MMRELQLRIKGSMIVPGCEVHGEYVRHVLYPLCREGADMTLFVKDCLALADIDDARQRQRQKS